MQITSEKARFPPLPVDVLTISQREVHDHLTQGPRGGVSGPFQVWIYAPHLADRLEALGNYCRGENSLPPVINELAVLLVARKWRSSFVWRHHLKLALVAGLPASVGEAIRRFVQPQFDAADQRVAFDFANALLDGANVDDETFATAKEMFGDEGVADLIGIVGYYGMVSMAINAGRIGAAQGDAFDTSRGAP